MGHSLPNSTNNPKMSPLDTDFDENLSAYVEQIILSKMTLI